MKTIGIAAVVTAGAILLAGCATDYDGAIAVDAIATRGDCAGADNIVELKVRDPGLQAYVHGFIANNCRHDLATSVRYMNLSARYGNADAQRDLAKRGQPVPAADLRPPQSQSSDDGGGLAALLLLGALSGYNSARGYDRPAPVYTDCSTYGRSTSCTSQ